MSLCYGNLLVYAQERYSWVLVQVDIFPIFWETSKLTSRVFLLFCNPTSSGGVFLFLHILTNMWCLSPEFLNLSILICKRWNLRVILICNFLLSKNAEHLFRCFSAFQDSYVVNYLFSSIAIYWYGYLVSWWLASWILHIFYVLILYRMWGEWRLFSNLQVDILSFFLTMPLALQKLSRFMRPHS